MERKTTKLRFFGVDRILPYLTHVRWQILSIVIFGLISSVMDIVIPQFQKYALDTFVGNGSMNTLTPFILSYLAVILTASVVNYISCAQATIVEVKVNQELRQVGFRHLQSLSFSYFNQNSVGYILARLMSDTSRIGTLVSWWLLDCTWRISYLAGAIIVMLRMNARLAMLILATLPLLVLLFSVFQKKLVRVNREIREVNSHITANFNEGIMGAKTIKALTIEEKMEQYGTKNREAMLRRLILEGYVIRFDMPELKEMLRLLRYMGNNINQLTRRVHETSRIYDEDLVEIRKKQDEICEGVRGILSQLSKMSEK